MSPGQGAVESEGLRSITVPGRRGRWGWRWFVACAFVLAPVLIVALMWVTVGRHSPWISAGLVGLLFTTVALPSVLPRCFGQAGRLWYRPERLGLTLPDLGVERPTYAVFALVAILAPWVVRWDHARVGSELSIVSQGWLWALPPCGIGLLLWLRRHAPTELTILRHGVVVRTNRGEQLLTWDELPDLSHGPVPRLISALRSIGITFPAHQLRSDPEVVADALEFYRTHTDRRAEIGTDAFVARLERGELGS